MRRKDVEYLVIVGMFLSGVYVGVSGIIAGLFGFPQFAWHDEAGYLCLTLIAAHIALSWSRIAAYVRRRFVRSRTAQSQTDRPLLPSPDRPNQQIPSLVLGRRDVLRYGLALSLGWLLGRWLPLPHETDATPSSGMENADLGALYHLWSKAGSSQRFGTPSDWGAPAERRKTYPNAMRVPLPPPQGGHAISLAEAIEQRRSQRSYSEQPLSPEALSFLLHAAQGITESRWGFRAAPSAGALYPLEVYVVIHSASGFAPGLYHYDAYTHALEQLRSANLRLALLYAGLGQEFLARAGACFVLTAIFQRTRWRYRERTYRYVLLEAGHVGQNLYLAAAALGLGACAVGAFLDDEINRLLNVDGDEEAALYLIAVGAL